MDAKWGFSPPVTADGFLRPKLLALALHTSAVAAALALLPGAGHAAGLGGAGILATGGAQAIVCSHVTGGLDADGITRAPAVDFSGGGNTLTLEAGWQLTGIATSAGGDTLALGGDATTACGGPADASFDLGQIAPDATFQGFSSYAKTGTSTWTLAGANGATTWQISAGTLQVDGDVGGANAQAGGTLSGTGSAGDIALAGGAIAPGAPGNTIGTLHGNAMAWSSGSFDFQLDTPAASDLLQLSGSLAKGGGDTFAFHFTFAGHAAPAPGTTFKLIGFGAQSGFDASDFSYDFAEGPGQGTKGHFVLQEGELDFVIDANTTVAPIPTLGAWALLLLGAMAAALGGLRVRRRR